ncbi:hypothetical protein [Clostridium sp. HBUAS56017]|uniref:hypothetical protein n=1 Tax=Clostridium sp. HBUAS56017 TaxID=2571128 RepID=UPI001177AC49|nr:hypothetical protein [Clostridium sp. HBUAS56017]
MEDEIKFRSEDFKSYDRKEIALAIRNSNYDDEIVCSLLDEEILSDCTSCSLKKICSDIDKISKSFKERTSTVVKSFQFE